MTEIMRSSKLGYRRSELCKYLGISERTFDRMRESGAFPPPDMRVGNGRVLLWLMSTLETWVASRTGATPETCKPSRARGRHRSSES
jgi:predicted DNA-binding transcriptional regulator AlpA